MKTSRVLVGLLSLAASSVADPTWPASTDELEEIMYQLTSFRARNFADVITPCSSEASGPGRQNAAEWLRTAFHDMSTANTFQGIGGLDASLQYELTNGENTGPGHNTTIIHYSEYVSKKASLADLIAMGAALSVKSCGGPSIPLRLGRVDATESGPPGVPQPQNSVQTMINQFYRMGFNVSEMIQVTACGHSLGGVHSPEFPDIVPDGSAPDGEASLDSTDAVFDSKIASEFVDGSTKNPLVVGPSVKINKHSDFKVFTVDGNETINALKEAQAFSDTCKTVLQKMIDVVPQGVTLGDPIAPYMVKPVGLQLTLAGGGTQLQWTGYIRVRTTNLPKENINNVVINYKTRNGSTTCGSGACTYTSTIQGVTQGFDESFAWFPINTNLAATSGISSFTVDIHQTDGTTTSYDNNGNSYPLQDAIFLQKPQSCVLGSSGKLTVTAAVRNDRAGQGAKAVVTYKEAQTYSPNPALKNSTVTLTKGDCAGGYTFFSADYTIPGGMAYDATVDLVNGDSVDEFKRVNGLGGSCDTLSNPVPCTGGVSGPTSTTTTTPTTTTTSSSSTTKSSSSTKTSTTKKSSTSTTRTTSAWPTKSTTTSKKSTTTSKKPTTTSKKPTTTSKKPTTTSKKPTTTSKKPTTTSKKPTTTSKKPTTTSKKPTTTSKPKMY